jgi:hypothetical protein
MKEHFCPVEKTTITYQGKCNWCGEREVNMTQEQKVFEALMTAKGYTDFTQVKGRYVNPGVQTRWNYFQLGWQLRGVQ